MKSYNRGQLLVSHIKAAKSRSEEDGKDGEKEEGGEEEEVGRERTYR